MDDSFELLSAIAAERGAVLIGEQRIDPGRQNGMRARLHCSKHGEFLAKIDRGRTCFRSWCTACRRLGGMAKVRARTRARLNDYVSSRGGKLLDPTLAPGQAYASIICGQHGLQRLSIRGALSRRTLWCAACKFQTLRMLHRTPFAKVSQAVRDRGWELVTAEHEYKSGKHIAVRCENGHTSVRSINSITGGTTCRSCYARVGESMVRAVFEQLFCGEFPLRRPRWLRSARGGWLELDGYNAELRLAFEYQGFTHYRRDHRIGEPLAVIATRDAEKAERCSASGVTLVHVPEMPQNVLYDPPAVFGWVIGVLQRYGISTAPAESTNFPAPPRSRRGLERLRRAAAAVGVELLEDEYKRCGLPLRVAMCVLLGAIRRQRILSARRPRLSAVLA